MYTAEYIHKDFIPGKRKQSPQELLRLMHEQRVTHLPMFENLQFIGNLSEEDLVDGLEMENFICTDYVQKFMVTNEQTVLDALRMMHHYHTNMVPVFDTDERYLGAILQNDIIDLFASTPFIDDFGATMLLSIATTDLSMTSIANIVESHNSKLLGSFILRQVEDQTKILIKVQSDNILSIGETFERFGYQVVQKYYNDEKTELLNDRYNQLIKFINP
ncbi:MULTISPECIES: CBS domain-containing protein [Weeksella]|uniref:CBS domain-containing protein n=1 Tax=Weeksella TaxID=1013 RepID=UPI0008A4CBBB|nr:MULTISPECIES: CBS domain-containing protein [Weeksella]MDK7374109.1 CBS domain-containing protein [Weeksella virosa]OFM82789.1 hypothetical protein HMPREF2660_03835 [Weeksella sp. HMSC059D05]